MIAKQMKVGMIIMYEGELWRVLAKQIIAPGNWRAFVQTKLRNVTKGTQTEHRFGADENIERAILDKRGVDFLYQDGDMYYFMDPTTYEQFQLNADFLGEAVKYLTPNMKLLVESHDEKPIGIELPQKVVMKVMETGPFIKSATATNQYKSAVMETGATFQVPGFINEGESIEIDTESGEYLGRAK